MSTPAATLGTLTLLEGDNLAHLRDLPDGRFDLIYVDPPFNTGITRQHQRLKTTLDPQGDRQGFGGKRYRSEVVSEAAYGDQFDDFMGFLTPRLREAKRLLSPTGSLFVHLDYREVHYCKVALDQLFGREHFINELIWAYDFGGRSKKKWSAKHDNILWYANDPKNYTFNFEAMDRIPYMAPGLVGAAKAKRGKTPTDVWWHTIVPTNGAERTGYPTQKPLGVLRRIIAVHSHPGDQVLDFFAGSGTTGEAALRAGRDCTLIDANPQAIAIIRERLAFADADQESDNA